MFRKIFCLIFFIVLVQGAFCQYPANAFLFEKSLEEMGYGIFEVTSTNTTNCTDYNFLLPATIDQADSGNFTIFTLNFSVLPINEGKAKILVQLNDYNVSNFETANSKCAGNSCTERILFPREKILSEKNSLKVCPTTTSTVSQISIANSSKIGVYRMPFFKKQDFVLVPESNVVLVGKDVKVKISIKNSGSLDAAVDLNYIKPIVEEKIEITAFKVLEGETRWSGTIKAGETKNFEYTIKTVGPIEMSLPASIACYENIFNERECIISNYPQLKVIEPEKKITAVLVVNELNNVNEKSIVQLVVKNIGSQTLSNIPVYLNVPEEFSIESGSQLISTINPNETKTLNYGISSKKAGTFNIGCQLIYTDTNSNIASCNPAKIVFEGKKIDLPLIAGVILLIIGIAIYAFIEFGSGNSRPSKK